MMENPFSQDGGELLPAIIQDSVSMDVLMLGYMNQEAFLQSKKTKKVTFFSRSKGRLWVKGETSGNFLLLDAIDLDCDKDTILIKATPLGPTCHLGRTSCFDHAKDAFLSPQKLENHLKKRLDAQSEGSYTKKLVNDSIDRVAQKVGEEAVEVVIASKNENRTSLVGEVADLVYHVTVLMMKREVSWKDISQELALRQREST